LHPEAPVRRVATPLIVAAPLLALGLAALLWYDYAATRRELLALLREQASSLRQAVAAAARNNKEAGAIAESQLAARLLDNARFLRELDRLGAMSAAVLADVAEQSRLFRVNVLSPEGVPQHALPGAGHGHGRGGPGFRGGGGALVERLLDGEEAEAVTDVHPSRAGRGERLAAGVRRAAGGVIVLTVDAAAVAELQRPASLDALLEDMTRSAPELAYTVLEAGGLRLAHGSAPPARPAAAASTLSASDEGESESQLSVDGRPVIEFAAPVPLQDGTGMLRLGMRLDGVRRAERRMLARLLASLAAAAVLAAFAAGTLSLRRRYGALSARHARAEEALRRRDRLSAMGELAATVSHELRNPLNAIAMSARRLRREFPQPATEPERAELDELLGVLEAETQRIDGRIRQFLELARPRALARQPTALSELLAGLVESRRALAEARGQVLELDARHAEVADVDPEQLRQALDNLLRNAIEATSAGGRVRVGARSDAGEHRIEIADSGSGIPPELVPRIFDLYFTTKAEGTGVGLAVAHQVVTAHGGTIEVESQPGAGTRMTVRLPRARRGADA
jgi:signal transduction histidine kinase